MNGQIIASDKREELKQSLLSNQPDPQRAAELEELKKTTLPIMFAVGISNVLYTNLHSFYPLYMEQNFPQLKSTQFGIILATFEVANLIMSLILGIYIGRLKRRNVIIYAYIVLFLGTLSFTTLNVLETSQYLWFFYLSILFRVIQGASSSAIQICAYSYATNEMTDEKDKYIGYVEIALGLGDMLGPAVGGFVFQLQGFAGTFLLFSAMISVGVISSIVTIPKRLNQKSQPIRLTQVNDKDSNESSDSIGSSLSSEYKQLTYGEFFKHPQSVVCLVSACFSVIFTLYIDCILALHLHSAYGVQHNLLGIFFLLSSITYVIGAPLSSYLSTKMNRRYVVFIAFLLMIVQNILCGPSELFGLTDNLFVVVCGTSMLGFNLSMALVPLLSELIETLEELDIYEPSQICDMTASMFNAMFNLGNLLAPLIAGFLYDYYGYKYTVDFIMVSTVVFCIVFYFVMIYKQDSKAKNL